MAHTGGPGLLPFDGEATEAPRVSARPRLCQRAVVISDDAHIIDISVYRIKTDLSIFLDYSRVLGIDLVRGGEGGTSECKVVCGPVTGIA
jgi:hypothetical protein